MIKISTHQNYGLQFFLAFQREKKFHSELSTLLENKAKPEIIIKFIYKNLFNLIKETQTIHDLTNPLYLKLLAYYKEYYDIIIKKENWLLTLFPPFNEEYVEEFSFKNFYVGLIGKLWYFQKSRTLRNMQIFYWYGDPRNWSISYFFYLNKDKEIKWLVCRFHIIEESNEYNFIELSQSKQMEDFDYLEIFQKIKVAYKYNFIHPLSRCIIDYKLNVTKTNLTDNIDYLLAIKDKEQHEKNRIWIQAPICLKSNQKLGLLFHKLKLLEWEQYLLKKIVYHQRYNSRLFAVFQKEKKLHFKLLNLLKNDIEPEIIIKFIYKNLFNLIKETHTLQDETHPAYIQLCKCYKYYYETILQKKNWWLSLFPPIIFNLKNFYIGLIGKIFAFGVNYRTFGIDDLKFYWYGDLKDWSMSYFFYLNKDKEIKWLACRFYIIEDYNPDNFIDEIQSDGSIIEPFIIYKNYWSKYFNKSEKESIKLYELKIGKYSHRLIYKYESQLVEFMKTLNDYIVTLSRPSLLYMHSVYSEKDQDIPFRKQQHMGYTKDLGLLFNKLQLDKRENPLSDLTSFFIKK